jgi:hypothetical protein
MAQYDGTTTEWRHFERIYDWAVALAVRLLRDEGRLMPTILFARIERERLGQVGIVSAFDDDSAHSKLAKVMSDLVDLHIVDLAVHLHTAKVRRVTAAAGNDANVVMFRVLAKHHEVTTGCDRLAARPWLIRRPLDPTQLVRRQDLVCMH